MPEGKVFLTTGRCPKEYTVEMLKRRGADSVILELEGKFDIEEAMKFESLVNEMLPEHIKRVAIDLEKITYIDSSAIGSIIKAMNLVRNYGGDLVLLGVSAHIRNIFALARLDTFFTIQDKAEFQL